MNFLLLGFPIKYHTLHSLEQFLNILRVTKHLERFVLYQKGPPYLKKTLKLKFYEILQKGNLLLNSVLFI